MKYSKEIVDKIKNYLRLGMRNEDAARLAGVSKATFYEWKAKKPDFLDSLKEAEDQAEAANLAVIQKAKNKQWSAAAWLLERRHPDKYSLRREITGPKGGPIPVTQPKLDLSGVDAKVLNGLLDQLEKRSRQDSRPTD